MRASRGERVCSRFLARLDGVAHLGGEVLWKQSFGSAGEGWDGPLRASICEHLRCPQPLRTRVLREDPAHVPGTSSGFRVHVLQTHRLEQGLVLVVGRGGARRAWVRRILGEQTAHRVRRVTSWVWCHGSAKKPGITRFEPPESANSMGVVNQRMLVAGEPTADFTLFSQREPRDRAAANDEWMDNVPWEERGPPGRGRTLVRGSR